MQTRLPSRFPLRGPVVLLAATLAHLVLGGLARAAECPATPPASMKERRTLAKEWFSRAETEELGGDDKAAVRAYSCSFAMLPHPSTAYNLAKAAERAGDLSTALTAHRDYLTLKPTASDRAEIEERIRGLEAKLGNSSPGNSNPGNGNAGNPSPSPPPPVATPTPAPEPEPAPPPRPVVRRRTTPAPAEPAASESAMGTREWVVAGVGAAALVAGVVFNVGARSAMNDCRDLAKGKNFSGARDACARAKPFAYLSYGLFVAAGAAAIVDVTFVLGKQTPVEHVGLLVVPGGGGLSASGRF
jgi:hypothetical protein